MPIPPISANAGPIVFDLRWARRPGPDGIGRYTLELFRALVAARPSPPPIGLYSDPEMEPHLRRALPEEARLERVGSGLFSPRSRAALDLALRRRGARFYVAPNYLGVPPRRRAGRVSVAVVHDLIPWEIREARRGNPRWEVFYRLPAIGRALLGAYDHLVAVSKRTAAAVEERFGVEPSKITVIPGAPAGHFTAAAEEDDDRRLARLGVKKPFLLYVGRDDRHKNLDRLVEAHRLLGGELGDRFPLVLAGPAKRAPKEPRVTTLETFGDDDLPALYRGARYVVLPSLLEGFGLPVVEGMACGTPALVSDREPMREVAGDGAIYFDPTDAAAMARTIEAALVENGRWEKAAAAARLQAARYSWEASAARMLALLAWLGGGAGGQAPA